MTVKTWEEIKELTNKIHSCQSPNGVVNKEDRAEAQALARQQQQAENQLSKVASQFLKANGYTASGTKRKKR